MIASEGVSYRIDAFDRISAVDSGWISFARSNSGESLLPPGILGRSLWRWIADATTCQVYRDIVARVRRGGGPVRFRFRCDAPDIRRLLEMRIEAHAEEVTFETRLLETQERLGMCLIDPSANRSDAHLIICGWCMRVPVGNQWVEIEDAITPLGLFQTMRLPMLSHGMCPQCYVTMDQAITETTGHHRVAVLAVMPAA